MLLREFFKEKSVVKSAPNKTEIKTSPQDLATFRERLKRLLKNAGISGRQLEDRIGIARGTLSKLYSGRMTLTLRLLNEIASVLAIEPPTLVTGTALAQLLKGAPELPGSDEFLSVAGERDDLRGQVAERDAVIESLREELANEQEARRQSEKTASRLDRQVADARARYDSLKGINEKLSATNRSLGQGSEKLARGLRQQRAQAQAAQAKADEMARVAQGWMAHATEREQRVKYMEGQLERLQKKALETSSQEANALLMTGLTALGIGLAVGSSRS